ncbi:ABC transporter substrate-binding protein [Lederbergia panacisoli]|uniref:ABC transporter substrate-binding protein n=1 Tax=Lederbergia panacisoli TaxID=1255251 RepID=UPI00214A9D3A|nr:ABC transporter substrate-binding protein [Lederbergia panacisoli]MCR2821474.1 ABC transporter substrate-binding protein [Lederbergia panacisoli]
MKFRSLLVNVLAILILLSMTACSSTGSSSKNNSSKDGDGVVEVTYWHMWTGDWKKLIDDLVNEFNESHPNIRVKALSIAGDADSKFLTAQAGGNPPDVMTQWNQVIPSWAEKGAILSLEEYISGSAPELKDWMYPVVAEIGSYKGEMYAVPFSMDAFAMFYNKDVFKEVGLDPENPPKTIEELDAMQDQLWKMDSRGLIDRVGFMPGGITLWGPAFGSQWADADGNITATHENNLQALQWFESYTKKYDPMKVASFNKSMGDNTINSTWPFLGEKTVFDVDGMWRLLDLEKYAPDLDYGVIPLPYPEDNGKPNSSWVGGNYNIIPKGAKHPEEAWEFILWLTGYKNEDWAGEMLPKGGWIPASPKITETAGYQDFMNEIPARKVFVDLFNSDNVQITPVIPVQQYYWDRLESAEESVMTGKSTSEKALEEVQKEVEKEMQKVK